MKKVSTEAKIFCYNCKKEFTMYWLGLKQEQILGCPHCYAEIDETMANMIFSTLATAEDTNRHFLKYHNERKEPLFTVDISATLIDTD